MPRMTWCLTGHLALLPIHAAGLYGERKISRYSTMSFRRIPLLLLHFRMPNVPPPDVVATHQLPSVSQPATATQMLLPGIVREVGVIQALEN